MAVWFARQSSVLMSAANVWNSAADGSGTWLTWPPAASDVLMLNSRSLNVPAVVTAAEIRNDAANGATIGGNLTCTISCVITANLYSGSTFQHLMTVSGSSNVDVIGDVLMRDNAGTGIAHAGTGVLTVTGSINHSAALYNYARGLLLQGVGSIIHVGTAVSGYGCTLVNNGAGTITTTCPLHSGSSIAAGGETFGLYNTSSGVINIYGDVIGGSGSHGAVKNGSGAINIYGYAIGSNYNGSGTRYYGAVNNHWSNFGIAGLRSGAYGISPINDGKFIKINGVNAAHWVTAAGAYEQFLSPDPDLPQPEDVRDGVTYNFESQSGTLVVPMPATVGLGIPYGSNGTEMTGTAIFNPADLWNVDASTLNTPGTIGVRLSNCATVSATAAIVSGLLDAASGPQGETGRNGIQRLVAAGEEIYQYRAVVELDEEAWHGDNSSFESAKILGISANSAPIGDLVEVIAFGLLSNPAWDWDTGSTIFLGSTGTLLSTPPLSNYLVILGIALSPTTIYVRIEAPIQRLP